MLNDAGSELYQKLLIRGFFPWRYSIRNISRPQNAKGQKNFFFQSTINGLSIDTSDEARF